MAKKQTFLNKEEIDAHNLKHFGLKIKGINYMITGTKTTKNGYSHSLVNLETNEQVKMNEKIYWIDSEKLETIKD